MGGGTPGQTPGLPVESVTVWGLACSLTDLTDVTQKQHVVGPAELGDRADQPHWSLNQQGRFELSRLHQPAGEQQQGAGQGDPGVQREVKGVRRVGQGKPNGQPAEVVSSSARACDDGKECRLNWGYYIIVTFLGLIYFLKCFKSYYMYQVEHVDEKLCDIYY